MPIPVLLAASLTIAAPAPAAATPPDPSAHAALLPGDPSGGWHHQIGIYLLAAGLDGETTVKGVDANVDVSFSDIWENLDAGAMFAYRAESERYALTLDTVYMGLAAEKDDGPLSTEVEFDELVVEVAGCLRTGPRTDVFLGARYWSLDGDVEISGVGPGVGAEAKEDWIDPLIGARHTLSLAERWSLTLRGDVGGFGVGSDFSWQAVGRVNWQVSESTTLALGYRVVDVDYEDGSGSDEFRYDVTTSGLLLGVVFGW